MKSRAGNKNGNERANAVNGGHKARVAKGSKDLNRQNAMGLKVVVPVAELALAIKRGGIAAGTKSGRSEVVKALNLVNDCVRIVADDAWIRFESSVSGFSSMYSMKVGGGVRVLERGVACVPLKELKRACARFPKGCEVSLSFVPASGGGVADTFSEYNLDSGFPNGIVVEMALVGDGSGAGVRIDSCPSDRFISAEYPDASGLSVVLRGKAVAIKEPYGKVRFAIDSGDLNELFNKVAVRITRQSISFTGTDGRRCSYATRSRKTFDELVEIEVPMLIPAEYLTPVLNATPDDENITLATDGDEKHAYVYCGAACYRISLPDGIHRAKYPNVRKLQGMRFGTVILAERKGLAMALGMASLVNDERCILTFSGNGSVDVGAKGFGAANASHTSVRCKRVSEPRLKNPSVGVSLRHLKDCVSRLSSDHARISFSLDETKVRIEDESAPQFTCFMQLMNLGSTEIAMAN